MEKILKTIKRTDDDLDLKFEGIRIELIEQLPPTMKEQVCIADDIENVLKAHVKDNGGKLVAKLQDIKFKKWGLKLELIPKKNFHFEKNNQ